jgi:hypothetical protein
MPKMQICHLVEEEAEIRVAQLSIPSPIYFHVVLLLDISVINDMHLNKACIKSSSKHFVDRYRN